MPLLTHPEFQDAHTLWGRIDPDRSCPFALLWALGNSQVGAGVALAVRGAALVDKGWNMGIAHYQHNDFPRYDLLAVLQVRYPADIDGQAQEINAWLWQQGVRL
ncbi:MAG TPA: hypothetical protein PKY30_09580, partial [Myxococcota bacterium]|nr:hypothetical protein [Myxococcota bacterium]